MTGGVRAATEGCSRRVCLVAAAAAAALLATIDVLVIVEVLVDTVVWIVVARQAVIISFIVDAVRRVVRFGRGSGDGSPSKSQYSGCKSRDQQPLHRTVLRC